MLPLCGETEPEPTTAGSERDAASRANWNAAAASAAKRATSLAASAAAEYFSWSARRPAALRCLWPG
eukprot:8231013-Alexandrium_andersonii.AAC.1